MKKRILALLMVFVLIFQIQFIQATEVENVENYAPYINSEAFLKAIGIVDGEIDYAATVTRGVAASYIAGMLNEKSNYYSYRGIFSDVDLSDENALAIEKLADLGVIHGDGNFAFRPDEHLTYNEAVIILMNVLGYALIPERNTYFEASRIGLLDEVIAEYDVVNFGDLFVMMENTLMSNPVAQTVYGTDVQYEVAGQTLIYKVFDIVYAEGIIVKNDLTYLWITTGNTEASIELETDDGTIEINSDKMDDLRSDLGKKVRVYYYLDRDTGGNVYVYHEIKSTNKILSIDFAQLEQGRTNFSAGKLAYYRPGKSNYTIVSLADDFNVIYNNAAYKNNVVDFTQLGKKVGNIELVDAESDGAYETVKIKAYDSLIVGNISLSNNFITDKYKSSIRVDIDEKNYEKIFVYDAVGNETELSDITSGSVISVAKSDTHNKNDVLEIRFSEDIRKGKITRFNKSETPSNIIMDEKHTLNLYDRAAFDEKGNEINYSVNTNIMAYVDVFGNSIYIADDKSRDMQYGIIVAIGQGRGLEKQVVVRLITAAGEIIETKLDEKSVIDGISVDSQKAYDTLSAIRTDSSTFTSGLTVASEIIPIRYKASEDGILKIIDTVKTGGEKNDDLEFVGGGTLVSASGNVLGHQIPFSSDAIVIEISSKKLSDIDVFQEVKNISSVDATAAFKIANTYDVIAYRSDNTSSYADFIIKFVSDTLDYDSSFLVIDEIIKTYNEDYDEEMYQLCGYVGGMYQEKWVSNEIDTDVLKSYNKGDILFVSSDGRDYISSYSEVLIREESGVVLKKPSYLASIKPNARQSLIAMCGYVKSVKDSLVQLKNYDFVTIEPIEKVDWTNNLYYTNLEGANFIVIDDERDKIYNGSVADILDYDSFENECSMILVRMRSSKVRDVFIYNK